VTTPAGISPSSREKDHPLHQRGGVQLAALVSENPKGPPSSLVQLRTAVWTGDTSDTQPESDMSWQCISIWIIYHCPPRRGLAIANWGFGPPGWEQ
jgi:hypothetical protein